MILIATCYSLFCTSLVDFDINNGSKKEVLGQKDTTFDIVVIIFFFTFFGYG